jgi:SSS family solute:Na+ symporter
MTISIIDSAIIILYLIAIVLIGVFSVSRGKISSDVYFLAGRNLKWPMVGAALFASNISTIHLIGLSASGYNEGMVWGNFEWMATFTLIILSLVFAPFYFTSRISTLPEFLEKRYSPASRTFLAFMAILGALFVHLGMSLYAGAVVFKAFFGVDIIVSILVISFITSIYTVLGGLKAVVITETIQTVVLIGGAVILTIFAVLALPEHGIHTLAEFKAQLKPGQLSILHSDESIRAIAPGKANSGLTWYAVFLGYPVLGIWYWCSDQTIVQRVLGAKTQRDAQVGPLFAGVLKLLPVFMLVLPGVIAWVLFRDKIGVDANQTFPILVSELMPVGLKGVLGAAMLAALMNTMASALNSTGTLVAVDIVKRIRPAISDSRLVNIGRVASVGIMLLAIAWSTQGGRFTSIFEAINKIASALAPPIATVFIWGVFSKRGTKEAAIVTLWTGFVLGVIAFCIDFIPISGHLYLSEGLGIPFMMQAWWLFCLCSAVYFLVSYATPRPDPAVIEKYTWDNPVSIITRGKITGLSDVRVLAGLLLLTLVVLYSIFA